MGLISLICLVLTSQSPTVSGGDGQVAPIWPLLPKARVVVPSKMRIGAAQSVINRPYWPTFELIYLPGPDRTVVDIDPFDSFIVRPVHQKVKVAKADRSVLIPATNGFPVDIFGVADSSNLKVFANGICISTFPNPKRGGAMAHGTVTLQNGDAADGTVIGFATYPYRPSPKQIAESNTAAQKFADVSTPSTKTATFDLTLSDFTPVPDPERMRPYRQALLAQEYTVRSVAAGHFLGIKPGAKIRVFRFGVIEGKKTYLQFMKKGDRAQLTIELLTADPKLENEYQIDTLNTSFGAYYVEVPKANP